MIDQDSRTKGLELLARHEEAIGELYFEYSKRFPEQKDFWLRLSREERKNAEQIRSLYPKVGDGTIRIGPDRFKAPVIEDAIKRIRTWTTDARSVDPDMGDALSNALTIEVALIDRNYRLEESDSQEMKSTFTALIECSRMHRRKVVQILNAFNEMNL